jgi:hypothetical protein
MAKRDSACTPSILHHPTWLLREKKDLLLFEGAEEDHFRRDRSHVLVMPLSTSLSHHLFLLFYLPHIHPYIHADYLHSHWIFSILGPTLAAAYPLFILVVSTSLSPITHFQPSPRPLALHFFAWSYASHLFMPQDLLLQDSRYFALPLHLACLLCRDKYPCIIDLDATTRKKGCRTCGTSSCSFNNDDSHDGEIGVARREEISRRSRGHPDKGKEKETGEPSGGAAARADTRQGRVDRVGA